MIHFETHDVKLAGQLCMFSGKVDADEGTIIIEAFQPYDCQPLLPVLLAYPTMGKLGQAIYNKLSSGICRTVAVRCSESKPERTEYFDI